MDSDKRYLFGTGTKTMKVERFEDLIVWQKARELSKTVYQLTRGTEFSKDFGLRDQMRRSAISIMSNIAEGFEPGTSAEYHQFIVIAKASCAELRSQLYAALDACYVTQEEFATAQGHAVEVAKLLWGLKTSIRQRQLARKE